MSFIGEDMTPSPKLKDVHLSRWHQKEAYKEVKTHQIFRNNTDYLCRVITYYRNKFYVYLCILMFLSFSKTGLTLLVLCQNNSVRLSELN